MDVTLVNGSYSAGRIARRGVKVACKNNLLSLLWSALKKFYIYHTNLIGGHTLCGFFTWHLALAKLFLLVLLHTTIT